MATARKKLHRRARALRPERLHAPTEAFDLVKSLANTKFDETVEVAIRLGVDPRKADQMVRGTSRCRTAPASRPRRGVRRGRRRPRGRGAGADVVGADDLVARSRTASSTSTSPSPRPT